MNVIKISMTACLLVSMGLSSSQGQENTYFKQRDAFLQTLTEAEFKIDTVLSSNAKTKGRKIGIKLTYMTAGIRYQKKWKRKILKNKSVYEQVTIRKNRKKYSIQRRLDGQNLFAMYKEFFVVRKLYADELLIIAPLRSSPTKWEPLYIHKPR